MSPEQCRGLNELTTKSDNYSLGCVMWTCLVGKPPFEGDSAMEVLTLHASIDPEKLQEVTDVPENLAKLIDGLLSKDPEKRPDLKGDVIPVLEELREELSLTLRDPEDDDNKETVIESETFVDYIRRRPLNVYSGIVLIVIVVSSIFWLQRYLASSEKFAVLTSKKTAANADAAKAIVDFGDRVVSAITDPTDDLESVRNGSSNELRIYSYDQKTLAECAKLPGLNRLDLSDTQFSDDDIKYLVRIPNLLAVMLKGTNVLNLTGIGSLKKVTYLELKKTSITNGSLQNIARMDSLTSLSLDDTKIGDEGLKHLCSMKKLDTLNLNKTKITSESARYLKQLPALGLLLMNGTNITGKTVREILSSVRTVKNISIEDCKYIDKGLVEALRREFPNVGFNTQKALLPKLAKDHERASAKADYKTGYEILHELIPLSETFHGKESVEHMSYIVTLGQYSARLGKYKEAEQAIAKVKLYGERKQDRTFLLYASDLQVLVYELTYDLKSAIATRKEGLRIQEQLTGPNSPEVLSRLVQLEGLLIGVGDWKAAMANSETTTTRLKSMKNPDPSLLVLSRLQHAECFRHFGKLESAYRIYQNLISKIEKKAPLSDIETLVLFGAYSGSAAIEVSTGKASMALSNTDKMIGLLKSGKFTDAHQCTLYDQRVGIFQTLGKHRESEEALATLRQIQTRMTQSTKNAAEQPK